VCHSRATARRLQVELNLAERWWLLSDFTNSLVDRKEEA
jgi:hypothetical protein